MHSPTKIKGVVDNKIMAILFIIIVVIILVPLIFFGNESDQSPPKENVVDTKTEAPEAPVVKQKSNKELMSVGYIDTKKEWITPVINYEFEFMADNHEFYVQFTSSKGGWTKKILIPANGNVKNIVPSDGTQGPARITAGKKELSSFEIRLYKKN